MFDNGMLSVKVNLGAIGKIYKLRLELLSQNTDSRPSWKVKTVSYSFSDKHVVI